MFSSFAIRTRAQWECPQFTAKFRDAQIALHTWILLSSFSHATRATTKSLFQLVCEIFGELGGQGERMGGRGAHPDSPPVETRLIAPNVAGSADSEVKSWGALGSTVTGTAQMEKEFKSSKQLELAENGGFRVEENGLKKRQNKAVTQYSPAPSIPGFSKLLDLMILHLGSTTEWQIIAIQCSPVYGTLQFFKADG
ncbi:hypothetical protein C8J57DRAFT_1226346 [Mycena rebaudengoi]|nr:hypothetical protein C8J57DRAFT_1226346 [Mycena rebaudengoi]